ncbi:MFS transporter [Acetobacter cerevisiae]|uniref:MFS transporter n=1 Tax=Acetobacter cerevisiae TaxID=178900 RepID=UPI0020A17F6E|nr:MFS transporter [Acetobacter cerevisiae]MCP1270662.1 MFS transporter [Acetobacter cerevisiae]MCP1278616.1 MFS transporter [Acetobacter cerevisiae]
MNKNADSSRYVFFGMIFLMYVISYGDRAALSISLPDLGREFSLSSVQMGWVSSSFLWSYFVLNLPSTILLDSVGARLVGSLAVSVWSCAMILGGMTRNVTQFILTRMLLGVGEAPTFGVVATIVRNWAKPQERGTVMTVLLTGMQIGLAGGTIAGAYLIAKVGWRFEFMALGVVGLIWALAWWLLYRNPEKSDTQARVRPIRVSEVLSLFRSSTFCGILVVQCTQNFLNFLLMSWVPFYLIHELHLNVLGSGSGTAGCYVLGAIGAVFLGRVAEYFVFRKNADPSHRRFIVAFCIIGSAMIGFLPFFHEEMPILAVLSLSLCCLIAANGANTAMLADMLQDGQKIGSVTGVTLTFSNALGLTAPILTGYIVAWTGNFNMAWYLCAVALIVAGLISLMTVRKPIVME